MTGLVSNTYYKSTVPDEYLYLPSPIILNAKRRLPGL